VSCFSIQALKKHFTSVFIFIIIFNHVMENHCFKLVTEHYRYVYSSSYFRLGLKVTGYPDFFDFFYDSHFKIIK